MTGLFRIMTITAHVRTHGENEQAYRRKLKEDGKCSRESISGGKAGGCFRWPCRLSWSLSLGSSFISSLAAAAIDRRGGIVTSRAGAEAPPRYFEEAIRPGENQEGRIWTGEKRLIRIRAGV